MMQDFLRMRYLTPEKPRVAELTYLTARLAAKAFSRLWI